MSLRETIDADTRAAMKAGDKPRLGALRLLRAAIQQVEVDRRVTLDDSGVLAVIDRMVKQRRDAIEQYRSAGRDELAAQEQQEIDVLRDYLPAALDEAEIDAMIDAAIRDTGAAGMQDMGRVMGALKPALQGRADLGAVSAKVKARLSARK